MIATTAWRAGGGGEWREVTSDQGPPSMSVSQGCPSPFHPWSCTLTTSMPPLKWACRKFCCCPTPAPRLRTLWGCHSPLHLGTRASMLLPAGSRSAERRAEGTFLQFSCLFSGPLPLHPPRGRAELGFIRDPTSESSLSLLLSLSLGTAPVHVPGPCGSRGMDPTERFSLLLGDPPRDQFPSNSQSPESEA